MRLTLTTKHRKLVIATGDDVEELEEIGEEEQIMVRLSDGDLTIAEVQEVSEMEPEDGYFRFGFQVAS